MRINVEKLSNEEILNKNSIISEITNKMKELEVEDLLIAADYIEFLDRKREISHGIDKESILNLLKSNGFENVKQLAKKLFDAKLIVSPKGGYYNINHVYEWMDMEIPCTLLQKRALTYLMRDLGYGDFSYIGNFIIYRSKVEDNIKED